MLTDTRSLRIDWVAPPFAGHLFPMLLIARGLLARGFVHQRVLSTPRYGDAVRAAGIAFEPILAEREAAILAVANGDARVGGSPLALVRQFRETVGFLAELRTALATEWARGAPDVAIVDSVLPAAGPLAREFGARWWTSLASVPSLECADAPPAYLGGLRPRGGPLFAARDTLGRGVVRTFKRVAHRLARAELSALGFPAVYRADGTEASYSDDVILALGHEAFEFGRAWPEALRFVGAPIGSPTRDHDVPAIDPARPHLLVTLGTHLGWAKGDALVETTTLARALPHWTVHFSHGDAHGDVDRTSGNLRELSWVPYGDGLARYAAVLHHGGAGITYATLAAGRPALVQPRDFDQFDNAARIVQGGFGLRTRSGRLARDLEALERGGFEGRCAALAAELRARDPVAETERLLAGAATRIGRA